MILTFWAEVHVLQQLYSGDSLEVEYDVNGTTRKVPYLLVDGIFPIIPVFVKSISQPSSPEHKLFAAIQEGCRKDVERCFGVLQAQFQIFKKSSPFVVSSRHHQDSVSCSYFA